MIALDVSRIGNKIINFPFLRYKAVIIRNEISKNKI